MNRAESKAQRLIQIEALLLDHPEGLSQSEIARRLEVNRSTIHRYLPDLTQHAPIFEEDGLIFIDRKSYLINLKLNLYEALSLHLATRLLTNRIERHNPHTASLLRKLANTIEKLSPKISYHLSLSADVADDPSRFQDPHYISVLETLALAWAEGRKVKIWHRHTETNKVYNYLFSVYFIEPYAVGFAIHAIGFREPPYMIRTLNLARIERVELTDHFYSIPDDFNPTKMLQQAWGIWYTENEPQSIILRFSSQVADRVLETQWHPSQQIQKEVDGSLIWQAEISEPQEMIPWIRGWGADCEVIAPTLLRNKIINEISTMQDLYINPAKKPYMHLWAKFSPGDEFNWHPLIYHMLDAAAVTQTLWEDCLSYSSKKDLASKLSLSIDEMGNLLAFWVANHDIGKAGPEFQKKNKQRQKIIKENGFSFPSPRYKITGFHATATTLILKRILSNDQPDMPRQFKLSLALTLGGHHGEFPGFDEINKATSTIFHVGDEIWQEVQNDIYADLKKLFKIDALKDFPKDNSDLNAFFMILAGMTTTADWIASNENFFPFLKADLPLDKYFSIAKRQSKDALTKLGWYGWKSSGEPATFNKLFQDFTPNELQQFVINIKDDLKSPFMAIIEAPTGAGKTEAALYLADTIIQREQKGGIYIAMPTQATSNQMYSRTAKYLSHRYPKNEINLHLVHGAALLQEKDDLFEPTNIFGEKKPSLSNLQAHRWFLPRKKTLLAPFGVGTVDQTFLSVLKSRHFFLRLFGLSHKVLIFDEVHAYDVYMTQIFKTLLHWLHAVGTSVIILTATLPPETRQELMKAYGAEIIPEKQVDFPRISIFSENKTRTINTGKVPNREIKLYWIDENDFNIVPLLENKLTNGGCAAVICNTVNRAQDVFKVVSESFNKDEVILFHSRFPFCWREAIEERVKEAFGKNVKNRPKKAILVATQVIEQSLDLDFDLMITDLAPVDLLIQRIGRLHRHQHHQNPPQRPIGLDEPTCIICAPSDKGSSKPPNFGSNAYIYDNYILYRTLLALKNRKSLCLPHDTDNLIQSVYSMQPSHFISEAQWEDLKTMKAEMLKQQANSTQNANNYLIPYSTQNFLGNLQSPLSDNLHSLSRTVFHAPTREISLSVQIVCLIKNDQGVFVLGEDKLIDLENPLTHQEVRSCLRATATISQWRIIDYFIHKAEKPPQAFQEKAALRWHYPVFFINGRFETDDFILYLDQQRGLYFEKKEF